MDSKLLLTIHLVSVNLFVVIYLVKTILLFTNTKKLDSFSKKMKVPEMLVSTLFLVTGIWLYAILGAIKTMQIIKLGLVVVSIPLAVTGFKKHRKGLALISFFLIVSAYGISEASRSKPYIPSKVEISGAVNTVNAEGVNGYLANCAMCHGPDGNKQYRGASLLSASRIEESEAVALITSGVKKGTKGYMPSFKNTLSEGQIQAVAAYIQGFKK